MTPEYMRILLVRFLLRPMPSSTRAVLFSSTEIMALSDVMKSKNGQLEVTHQISKLRGSIHLLKTHKSSDGRWLEATNPFAFFGSPLPPLGTGGESDPDVPVQL